MAELARYLAAAAAAVDRDYLLPSPPPSHSRCPSCRRCSAADELSKIARDLSILSLLCRHHPPNPARPPPNPPANRLQRLKDAAKATVLDDMNRSLAYPRLPRGLAVGNTTTVPRLLPQRLGHRKAVGVGRGRGASAARSEARTRKQQVLPEPRAAGVLQEQKARIIQSRVNPFQRNGVDMPRKEPGSGGTGVFIPLVMSNRIGKPTDSAPGDGLKRKIPDRELPLKPNYPPGVSGGSKPWQERRRRGVDSSAVGEVKVKHAIGGRGGYRGRGGGRSTHDGEEEEDDCYDDDLPVEMLLPPEWTY